MVQSNLPLIELESIKMYKQNFGPTLPGPHSDEFRKQHKKKNDQIVMIRNYRRLARQAKTSSQLDLLSYGNE